MRHPKWETLPEDIQFVRERFEAWRQTRPGRSRIPAELWAAAAGLTRQHGMHRVARALGLNDFVLRKHVMEAAPDAVPAASSELALAQSNPSASQAPEASADGAARDREPGNTPLPAPPQPATADHAPTALAKPAPSAGSLPHSLSPAAPAFIQLPWPALAPAAAAPPPCCVVELLHPGGARMTITLHDPGGAGHASAAQPGASGGLDLAALARAFWSPGP